MFRSSAIFWMLLSPGLTALHATAGQPPARPPVFADLTPDEAIAANAESDRILIVKATATWCAPCKKMDATTWRDERIESWFAEHGVAVEMDIDKHKQAAATFGIRSVPTMIAFKKGRQFDRIGGYRDAAEFLRWLEAVRQDQREGDRRKRLIDEQLARKQSLDMRARLDLARKLAESERFDEATSEYVWLWNNMVKHERSMHGVRGSFMASDMRRLAQASPDALAEFRKLRDQAAELVTTSKKTAGLMRMFYGDSDQEARHDWIVLNEVIGEEDETIQWFRSAIHDPKQKKAVMGLAFRLKNLLISKQAWSEAALLIPDPLDELRSAIAFREMDRQTSIRVDDPEIIRIGERSYRRKVAEIYAVMLAAGRENDARKLADAAMESETQDPSAMRCALVTQALKAEQPRPVHFEWVDELTCSDAPDLRQQLEGKLGIAPRRP